MDTEIKICASCKHYRRSRSPIDATPHLCTRSATERIDVVTGEVFYQGYSNCKFERSSGACTSVGIFFEPRG